MQQMAGYVFCQDNKFQKFFYLLGDGSNGKSIFLNMLEAVYGHENCSSVQPSRMGTQFDPIALKDSLANFCYEAKTILNGSEEALKAIASGDPIMAAHKGVDAVKFQTRAKIFIAANKVFATDDVSWGFLRRILFLKFDQVFQGEDANKDLYTELLQELPGIFNWCLAGYRDLVNSGAFQELEEQSQIIDELLSQMSPTIAFARETLPFLGQGMDEMDLYRRYRLWCEEGGYKRLNRSEFMKDITLLIRQGKYPNVKVVTGRENRKYFVVKEDEAKAQRPEVIALGGGEIERLPDEQIPDEQLEVKFATVGELVSWYEEAGFNQLGNITYQEWRELWRYYHSNPDRKPPQFERECVAGIQAIQERIRRKDKHEE